VARDDEGRDGDGGFRRRTLVLVVLGVAVFYGLGAAFADIGEALRELTRGSILPLLGAAAAQTAATLLWPQVFRASARAVGAELPYRAALNVSLSSFTLSHTVPGGGAVGAAVAVSRLGSYGLSGPAATSAGALAALVSMTTAAGVGAAGIAVAVVAGELPDGWLWVAAPTVLVLVGIVVGIATVLRSPSAGDRVIGLLDRIPKLQDRTDEWQSSLRRVTEEDPPSSLELGWIAFWATIKWTATIAALALVFVAFGQTPRLTVILVGFGVSQLAAAIPITPGGVGFVEGGMVAAFVALGSPASFATSVVLAYRVFETWGPALAGVPALLRPPDG
jgi:uncharacterized membrane protein YbhN (UPF0104 family)